MNDALQKYFANICVNADGLHRAGTGKKEKIRFAFPAAFLPQIGAAAKYKISARYGLGLSNHI